MTSSAMQQPPADSGPLEEKSVAEMQSQLVSMLDSADINGALAACNRLRSKLETLSRSPECWSDLSGGEEEEEDESSLGGEETAESSSWETDSSSSVPHQRLILQPVASLVAEAALWQRPLDSTALVVAKREVENGFGVGLGQVIPPTFAASSPRAVGHERRRPSTEGALVSSEKQQSEPEPASSGEQREDFVSDVSTMKQIFHLASSHGATKRVSVAVHRVGKTLVLSGALDEAEEDNTLGEVDPETGEIIMVVPRTRRAPEPTEEPSTLHVLDDDDDDDDDEQSLSPSPGGKLKAFLQHYYNSSRQEQQQEQEKEEEEEHVVPSVVRTSEAYERVVRWRLDGIETLLGSDALVFSTGNGEASLHMCEVGQRFSEVAALNMWLENKMTAVENCAICYHKQGHVAGCQIMKTDDLHNVDLNNNTEDHHQRLEDRVAVLQRARSILDFLQQHCTEDEGTYCLTRSPHGDQTVHLYRVDNKKKEHSRRNSSPFDETVATLCLRIARRVGEEEGEDHVEGSRKLLERCVRLCRPGSLRLAEAYNRLAASYLDCAEAHRLEAALDVASFGVAVAEKTPSWRVAMPNKTNDEKPNLVEMNNTDDFVCGLKRASLGLATLKEAARRRRLKKKKNKNHDSASSSQKAEVSLRRSLEAWQKRARLLLATSAYRRELPGDALRFLASNLVVVPKSSVGVDDRVRFALVYALMASRVREDNVDAHRRALHDRRPNAPSSPVRPPKKKSSISYDDDSDPQVSDSDSEEESSEKLPATVGSMPVEVSADVEANLSRCIKALIAALRELEPGSRGRDSVTAVLRVVYTALGERYLSVERLTKAARHLAEGLELFRSLGEALTESWISLRFGVARFRLAKRQQTTAEAKKPKLTAALETMQAALKHIESVHQEDEREAGPISCFFPTASIQEALQIANSIVAKASLVLAATGGATMLLLTDAVRHATLGEDDVALSEAHYRIASTKARAVAASIGEEAEQEADAPLLLELNVLEAHEHFNKALVASDRVGTSKSSLESLSMRVDAATMLKRVAASSASLEALMPLSLLRAALNVTLGAAKALEFVAKAKTQSILLPIVVGAILGLLHDLLKQLVRLENSNDPISCFFPTLKEAYASSLRLPETDATKMAAFLGQTHTDLAEYILVNAKGPLFPDAT